MIPPPFIGLGPPDAPILLVGDHAGRLLPPGCDLGFAPHLLDEHVGVDIGVAEVAALMVQAGQGRVAAHLGRWTRLLVDLNRHEGDPGAVPLASDGHAIPGNALDHGEREERLDRFFRPYHATLAARLARHRPRLIVSLHSFTPRLASRPDEARPWHIGILYGASGGPSRAAIAWLRAHTDWCVGDQQPYSGLLLNATMDRHAEAAGIAYVGVEMRQDLVADPAGQQAFAAKLLAMAQAVAGGLPATG